MKKTCPKGKIRKNGKCVVKNSKSSKRKSYNPLNIIFMSGAIIGLVGMILGLFGYFEGNLKIIDISTFITLIGIGGWIGTR